MEKDDKGSTMIRMGVSGWKSLLVPAYPGCPGSKAVKRSLLGTECDQVSVFNFSICYATVWPPRTTPKFVTLHFTPSCVIFSDITIFIGRWHPSCNSFHLHCRPVLSCISQHHIYIPPVQTSSVCLPLLSDNITDWFQSQQFPELMFPPDVVKNTDSMLVMYLCPVKCDN